MSLQSYNSFFFFSRNWYVFDDPESLARIPRSHTQSLGGRACCPLCKPLELQHVPCNISPVGYYFLLFIPVISLSRTLYISLRSRPEEVLLQIYSLLHFKIEFQDSICMYYLEEFLICVNKLYAY